MKRIYNRLCGNWTITTDKRLFALGAIMVVMSLVGFAYILRINYHFVQRTSVLPETPASVVFSKTHQRSNISVGSVPSSVQCLRERQSPAMPVLPGDSSLPYPSCILPKEPSASPDMFLEPKRRTANDTYLKKILFWNDNYVHKHFGFGFGRKPFLVAGCRVTTCTTTSNRTLYPMEEVDALVWHFRSRDRSLPQYRSPHTRYIFWLLESPCYLNGDLRNYHNVFNWTFTYRLDSDIPQPYDRVFRRLQPLPPTNRNYAAGKTKLAAWFVSHCNTESGRERLVKTLQQRVPVDVYGKCGPLKCDKRKSCYEMLNTTYKFYLSFENSLCRDYITEKFFDILRLDVVPVVFGLGSYSAHAPPDSYIDALSFSSVSALADHLLYLDNNDTAYNEYFRWKRFHQQFDRWTLVSQQYCALCEMLHSDAPENTYDLHSWYTQGGHCKNKDSPDISHFINGG